MQIMAEAAGGRDRQSRRELLETIEQQKEQISRYETRLRDVVRAYKGLSKEKEALENSLAIISQQQAGATAAPPTTTSSSSAENLAGESGSDRESQSGAESQAEDQDDQAKRIATLANSLSVVTAEKSRLEAMFQEDKKKMRADISDKDKTIDSLKTELESTRDKLRKGVDEAKSKLIIERHNREKETNDHALMLRELQKLVADERIAKEKLETDLQQARDAFKTLQQAGSQNQDHERQVRDLEGQLKAKDVRIKELTAKTKQTPPEFLRLKEELAEIKKAHQRDLERAEQKTAAAEERAQGQRKQQEDRVINLEARLQELSETVGTYDRLRQQDQTAMLKLKDKIHQLEKENKSLQSSSAGSGSESPDDPQQLMGDNDSNLDVQSLIERILRLRAMLRDANRRSENPIDLDELLESGGDGESAKKWKKSYYQIKEEFDRFKIMASSASVSVHQRRSPSPLSSPSKKSSLFSSRGDEDELFRLKSHISELSEQIKYLKKQLVQSESKEHEAATREAKYQETIADLKLDFKDKLEARDAEAKLKMLQLESEVQKQRDRCLVLIGEKDEELERMRKRFEASNSASAAESNLLEDLSKVANDKAGPMVLHYTEELEHNKIELRELRSRRLELEAALHELQGSALAKEQRYVDEIEVLRENMTRMKRMTTKEGANLEYLKNVVLTYMLSTDAKSKEHMLKAIGAVLLFSDQEVRRVHDYNASWWPSSSGASKKGHR